MQVTLCDGIDGASIWNFRIDGNATTRKKTRLRQILGDVGFAAYESIVAAMEATTGPHVQSDWWYLSILGVAPVEQRRGHGRAVLLPVLARADTLKKTCYLETFSDNLQFYQRLGFVPVVQLIETTTNSPYWVMSRPPLASIDS